MSLPTMNFCWWDKEKTLLLIKPEILEQLPFGTLLGCIDGSIVKVGRDKIDDDTRGGFLAYGFRMASRIEELGKESK